MPAGTYGAMSRTTCALTEPTSDRIAPRLRRGAISRATSAHWPTGMQAMTRSAPSTAAALLSATWSASPSSITRRRVAGERAVATIWPTSRCARAARAIEEPIRPVPISARRPNSGSAMARSRHELCQGGDHQPVRLLGADAHAQRMRQAIGADLAQDETARGQHPVGIRGRAAIGLTEMDEDEIRGARRHLKAELADLGAEPTEPFLVMGGRALDMAGVGNRRNACRDRRSVDVEGPADAVDRIDHMGRAIHPAEAQCREPVNLGERAAHYDVLGARDELDPGF